MSDTSGNLAVSFAFEVRRGPRGKKQVREIDPNAPPAESDLPAGRTPRVSRLMALALQFDELLRSGEVTNFGAIARLGQVSRPRVTQIMNLLLLAPDIQEALLTLPRSTSGKDFIAERHIRPIAAIVDWDRQRIAWRRLMKARTTDRRIHQELQQTSPSGS